MRKRRIIVFVILLTGLYLLLAVSDVDKERTVQPAWITRLTTEKVSPGQGEDDTFSFRLNNVFGYMNSRGRLILLDRVLYGTALSGDYYINYSNVPQNLIARDRFGYIAFNIDQNGYPVIAKNRCIVVSSEANGLSEWDSDGTKIWQRWFGSTITSLEVQKEYITVGFLDGTLKLINREGDIAFSYIPENSRIGVIYGCALSPGGKRLALISGLGPQRLTILEAKEDTYKVVSSRILDSNFRRALFIRFYGDYLFFEGDSKLYRMEVGRKAVQEVPFDGTFSGMEYDPVADLYYIVSRNNSINTIRVMDPSGHILIKTGLPGKGFFGSAQPNAYILGSNYNLMRINLVEN